MGKAKIRFIGGKLDSQTDEVDVRFLLSKISHETGMWFRSSGEGMDIMSGGKRDSKWHSFSVEQYKREGKSDDGHCVYRFDEIVMVDRCTSNTQKGALCMNPGFEGNQLCRTHKDL